MSFEHFERGYLLPEGCRDLIDLIRLGLKPQSEIVVKLPLLQSKPQTGVFFKPDSPPPPMKGDLLVSGHTTVKELAALLGQKPFKIIADALELGIFANVDQALGFDSIAHIAGKYGYTAKRTK
jgi:hypothetical protein